MKLDRTITCVVAATAVALACLVGGCSAPSAPLKSATSATAAGPAVPNVVGTTNLMSAELQGPAPKVGKAHLAVDDDGEDVTTDEPKAARRSDGSHRRGGFGTSK